MEEMDTLLDDECRPIVFRKGVSPAEFEDFITDGNRLHFQLKPDGTLLIYDLWPTSVHEEVSTFFQIFFSDNLKQDVRHTRMLGILVF